MGCAASVDSRFDPRSGGAGPLSQEVPVATKGGCCRCDTTQPAQPREAWVSNGSSSSTKSTTTPPPQPGNPPVQGQRRRRRGDEIEIRKHMETDLKASPLKHMAFLSNMEEAFILYFRTALHGYLHAKLRAESTSWDVRKRLVRVSSLRNQLQGEKRVQEGGGPSGSPDSDDDTNERLSEEKGGDDRTHGGSSTLQVQRRYQQSEIKDHDRISNHDHFLAETKAAREVTIAPPQMVTAGPTGRSATYHRSPHPGPDEHVGAYTTTMSKNSQLNLTSPTAISTTVPGRDGWAHLSRREPSRPPLYPTANPSASSSFGHQHRTASQPLPPPPPPPPPPLDPSPSPLLPPSPSLPSSSDFVPSSTLVAPTLGSQHYDPLASLGVKRIPSLRSPSAAPSRDMSLPRNPGTVPSSNPSHDPPLYTSSLSVSTSPSFPSLPQVALASQYSNPHIGTHLHSPIQVQQSSHSNQTIDPLRPKLPEIPLPSTRANVLPAIDLSQVSRLSYSGTGTSARGSNPSGRRGSKGGQLSLSNNGNSNTSLSSSTVDANVEKHCIDARTNPSHSHHAPSTGTTSFSKATLPHPTPQSDIIRSSSQSRTSVLSDLAGGTHSMSICDDTKVRMGSHGTGEDGKPYDRVPIDTSNNPLANSTTHILSSHDHESIKPLNDTSGADAKGTNAYVENKLVSVNSQSDHNPPYEKGNTTSRNSSVNPVQSMNPSSSSASIYNSLSGSEALLYDGYDADDPPLTFSERKKRTSLPMLPPPQVPSPFIPSPSPRSDSVTPDTRRSRAHSHTPRLSTSPSTSTQVASSTVSSSSPTSSNLTTPIKFASLHPGPSTLLQTNHSTHTSPVPPSSTSSSTSSSITRTNPWNQYRQTAELDTLYTLPYKQSDLYYTKHEVNVTSPETLHYTPMQPEHQSIDVAEIERIASEDNHYTYTPNHSRPHHAKGELLTDEAHDKYEGIGISEHSSKNNRVDTLALVEERKGGVVNGVEGRVVITGCEPTTTNNVQADRYTTRDNNGNTENNNHKPNPSPSIEYPGPCDNKHIDSNTSYTSSETLSKPHSSSHPSIQSPPSSSLAPSPISAPHLLSTTSASSSPMTNMTRHLLVPAVRVRRPSTRVTSSLTSSSSLTPDITYTSIHRPSSSSALSSSSLSKVVTHTIDTSCSSSSTSAAEGSILAPLQRPPPPEPPTIEQCFLRMAREVYSYWNSLELVVYGGRDDDDMLTDVESLTLFNSTWRIVRAPLSAPRYGAASTSVNHKMYLFGGHETSTVECYIKHFVPPTNRGVVLATPATVNQLSYLPVQRFGAACARLANVVFLFGGLSSSLLRESTARTYAHCLLASTETYSIDKDEYSLGLPLPRGKPRVHACAVAINSKCLQKGFRTYASRCYSLFLGGGNSSNDHGNTLTTPSKSSPLHSTHPHSTTANDKTRSLIESGYKSKSHKTNNSNNNIHANVNDYAMDFEEAYICSLIGRGCDAIVLLGGEDESHCMNSVDLLIRNDWDRDKDISQEPPIIFDDGEDLLYPSTTNNRNPMGNKNRRRGSTNTTALNGSHPGWRWVSLPPMKQARSGCCAALCGGLLVVAGGMDGHRVLSSVEAFDFEKNEWIDLPSLEQPRFLASMSVLQGIIYVVGGSNGQAPLRTVEMYTAHTHGWHHLPSMAFNRVGAASAILLH